MQRKFILHEGRIPIRKLWTILFLIILIIGIVPVSANAQTGMDLSWYQKDQDRFEIDSAGKLAGLAAIVNGTAEGMEQDNFAGKTVVLKKDIDLNGETWTPVGSSSNSAFCGIFDGDGHNISNLTINSTASGTGFFGNIAGKAKIKNVNIVSGDIKGKSATGSLVGKTAGSSVILNCSNQADVSGSSYVGGVVGNLGSNDCYIMNCFNKGAVSGTSYGVGGVAGCMACSGENLYNTGNVKSTYKSARMGGIVGDITGAPVTLKNCYSKGTVTATNPSNSAKIGGIAGMGYKSGYPQRYADYVHCYYEKFSETIFGLGGEGSDREGTSGKTPEELKVADLGAGFIREDVSNDGYPVLKWEKKTVNGKYDYDVDETVGLDIGDEGILEPSATGFKVNMNHRLSYTKVSKDDFTVTVTKKEGTQEEVLENLSCEIETDNTATKVIFSFKEIAAETTMIYKVRYQNGEEYQKEFTTGKSSSWFGYAADRYAGGDGSAANPYQIGTEEQLARFGREADTYDNKFFVLTKDLDMGAHGWYGKNFNGNFDGQGHSIQNLNVTSGASANYIGFFSRMIPEKKAYVQNLTFESPVIQSENSVYIGVLAGYAEEVNVENCHIMNGSITGKGYGGGLIGFYGSSTDKSGKAVMSRCSSTSDISLTGMTGGLICYLYYSSSSTAADVVVEDCYVGGSLEGTMGAAGIFNITGNMNGITVNRCYTTANVIGTKDKTGGLTGFVPYSGRGTIDVLKVSNCVGEIQSVSDGTGNTGSTNSGRLIAQGHDIEQAGIGKFQNNYALASMKLNGAIAQESVNNGTNITPEMLSTKEFWSDKLGFDLEENGIWHWDGEKNRPSLNPTKQGEIKLTITEQPQDAIAYNNKAAIFGVKVSGGTMGYTYQWQYSKDKQTWEEIAGETKDAVSVEKKADFAKDSYYYRCVVKDSTDHRIESEGAKLTLADARFNVAEARRNLLAYYGKNKTLSYAGEPFSLASAGVDISDYGFKILTYNGYFSDRNGYTDTNMIGYLFLDAYVRGVDITTYPVTGSGAAQEEDLLNELLEQQEEDTGRVRLSQNPRIVAGDDIALIMALDMYYGGASKWGNVKEGTKKGRDGAIEYLLNSLKNYTGGGKYWKELNAQEKTMTANADFVLMMSRLTGDKKYGKQAKEAMEDVLECMENLYDSDKVTDTRTAARYVSAFVAGADLTDSVINRNHYLSLAKEMMETKILPSVAADGSYCEKIGQNAMEGKEDATVAVLLALADYKNEKSVFTTYAYQMPDEVIVRKDLSLIEIENPVVTDLELVTEGRYGSTISWGSSNEKVIDPESGAVTRSEKDKKVTLTATAKKGNAVETKEVDLTVKADADGNTDAVDAVLRKLSLPIETYENLTLPVSPDETVKLEWSSSDEKLLTADGKITRPEIGTADGKVTLTATVSKGEVSKKKAFPITVLAKTGDKVKMAYNKARSHWLNTKHISGYWNVYAAYSALGDYIQDPANGYTFELEEPDNNWYGVQYGGTVLAIVAMGENPYNYKGRNWVELLEKNYGGMYAAPVYSQLGMNAAGADKTTYKCGASDGINLIRPSSMSMGIDIAGWAAVIAADHKGEPGVDEAVQEYLSYLKKMSMAGDGNISGSNYISTGCTLLGLSGLMHAGYENCDAALPPWVSGANGSSIIDAVYDNNFEKGETISGYLNQAEVAICDYYNAKYKNRSNGWIECRVSKDRLRTQIGKAKAILAEESKYTPASIETLKKALEAANAISAARLNEKIADYGKEYYALYDAVRYIKLKSEDDPEPQKQMKVKFRLIGDADHEEGKHDSYVTWIPTTEITLDGAETTVYDVFVKALEAAGLKEEGAKNGYVGRIQAPSVLGGYWLGEFDNGKNSGWMFTLNGVHPQSGLKSVSVKDGDSIIWHYVDDYTVEENKNTWLEAPDVAPTKQDKPGGSTEKPGGSTEKPGSSTEKPGTTTEKPEDPTVKATKEVKAIKMTSLKAKKYKKAGITLTWNSSKSSYKLNGYKVYRSTRLKSGYKLVKTVKGKKLTIKKGLKKGRNYYYRVRGYRKINGKVVYTKYRTIIVNLDKKKAVKTLKLPGLKAKASKGKVTLTWDDHMSMYKLKGYRIYKSTKKTKGFKKVASVKKRKAVMKKGLKKGKTYYFKVQGFVKIGKKTVYTKPALVKVKAK